MSEFPKRPQFLEYEPRLYQMWEKAGYFTPRVPRGKPPKFDLGKKPFTIILPLPNANDPLHAGHAMFVIEDILARFHRMLGEPTLWLPGADHAGIETQFVFEKYLAKQGKSRFDFDRETLFGLIWDFVEKNRELNKNQLKRLGFSLDWTRYHYSLEPEIIEKVLETFRKLHQDGLIYRGERLVNYCPQCGTAFSDLEVNYQEREDWLYYLDYGTIQIATTRPETIFADVAVAVNSRDKKYKNRAQTATLPLINLEIPIIADELVQPNFGTGALKITPAHDAVDFEIGQKHQLPIIRTLNHQGRLDFSDPRFAKLSNDSKRIIEGLTGFSVVKAREKTIEFLEKEGKLIKKEPLAHSVGHCYRCGLVIEPMILPQWFVKTKPLAKPAIEAVKKGQTRIFPKKRFEKMYFDWMERIEDWNISRQIVWGPQIPVWYCLECNPKILLNFLDKNGQKISGTYQDLKEKYAFEEIKAGLQTLTAEKDASYQLKEAVCERCQGSQILQETDTFDTWFLSGQWPITTLGFAARGSKSKIKPSSRAQVEGNQKSKTSDLDYFYPTSVLDTLWDILFLWVGRMMMLGIYLTGDVPFKVVHLHARVVDKHGQKMSKSKGNVIDPMVMVEKYGADALRWSLVFGIAPASDISLGEEKLIGARNFITKIWNISRFALMQNGKLEPRNPKSEMVRQTHHPELSRGTNSKYKIQNYKLLKKEDREILNDLNGLVGSVTKKVESYQFGLASEGLYAFIWNRLASGYLESIKDREDETAVAVLLHVLREALKLLHPFMPYVSEEIYQKLPNRDAKSIMIAPWPKSSQN